MPGCGGQANALSPPVCHPPWPPGRLLRPGNCPQERLKGSPGGPIGPPGIAPIMCDGGEGRCPDDGGSIPILPQPGLPLGPGVPDGPTLPQPGKSCMAGRFCCPGVPPGLRLTGRPGVSRLAGPGEPPTGPAALGAERLLEVSLYTGGAVPDMYRCRWPAPTWPLLGEPDRARRNSLDDDDKSHWPLGPTTSTSTGVRAHARPLPISPEHEADLVTIGRPLPRRVGRFEAGGPRAVALRTEFPKSAALRNTALARSHSANQASSRLSASGRSGHKLMARMHSSKALRKEVTFS